MFGIVERIRYYPEKGKTGVELSTGHLMKNLGLEGDYHAGGGERQISILFTETRGKIISSKEQALCFTRFRENITINCSGQIAPGTKLAIGEALIEITGETKKCHDGCSLNENEKSCPLRGLNPFAKVVQSGFIRTGDSVEIDIDIDKT